MTSPSARAAARRTPPPHRTHDRPDAIAERERRRRLLGWYRRSARVLPWRETRDPYRVWLSEVMLQQTQVSTVIPYYLRFLERFPNVGRLASAPRSEVLRLWSGLGYYRRARHLHEAAGLLVREHDARVPADPESFGRLPGVGRYTAGAVLSIAFGRPLPVLDGNVARVLSRWYALPGAYREAAAMRRLWDLAGGLVPMRAPGDWNQALMELGATVCLPRSPRCDVCPVAKLCRARSLGRPEAFPRAARRRATVRLRRAIVWIERRGRVLVERLEGRLLDGLWEPPGAALANARPARAALESALGRLGVKARLSDAGVRVRHTITHRAIEVELWLGQLTGRTPIRRNLRWVSTGSPEVALTALTKKAGRRLEPPAERRDPGRK